MNLDDAGLTAIRELTTVNGETSKGPAPLYTLDGRRITGIPSPGIYVSNGRKVIVRR